jgi:biotin transport system substrate-specific component
MTTNATDAPADSAIAARVSPLLLRAAGTIVFALLLALSARWRIPLPWSPVPVTGQTLTALLLPAFLGPVAGAGGVVLYLLLGLSGMPLFALGGGGIYLLGPTGGYLWGFLLASLIVGTASRGCSRFPAVFAAMILGEIAILSLGALQLAVVTGADWRWVFAAGVWPFLPGDLIKLILAGGIYHCLLPRLPRPGVGKIP